MSTYGVAPLGTGQLGGPGTISALSVLPLTNNRMVVVYDTAPRADDPAGVGSATNPSIYTLTPVNPTYTSATVPAPGIVPAGAVVPTRSPVVVEAVQDEEDPTQIILTADAMLEPGVSYDLLVETPLCGEGGETYLGPFTLRVAALSRPTVLTISGVAEERYRDFDYIFAPGAGESEGTYRLASNRDIGLQDADASLRKRIYRRIFSGRGAFAFLSASYGVGVKVKALAMPGRIQELAGLAAEQIRAEPDVQAAAVEAQLVRTSQGSYLNLVAHVRRRDARAVRMRFQRPVE